MVDGDNEDRKQSLALPGENEVDIIIGEADCPYYDFISVSDRWLPTEESFRKALDGEFEACYVVFSISGSYVVPWNKKKFKRELAKFTKSQPTNNISSTESATSIRKISKKELMMLAENMPNDDEDEPADDEGK